MCQPKRWLWGLLPLALLWAVGLFLMTGPIQTNLTKTATDRLQAGFPWASVSLTGRDATLTGTAPSAEAQAAAESLADNTNGVRLVNNTTGVLPTAKPWTWSAVREGNKLTLGGFVANDASRKAIVDQARATLPGTEITDGMKLAQGATPLAAAAASYSLTQIGRLPDGKASLSDVALTLSGTAPSLDAYAAATAFPRPQGLTGADTIGLPTVRPYQWQAQKAGNTVTLTGLAPSDAARMKIADAVKAAVPNASIVNQLRLAAGAPASFDAVTGLAVSQLAKLNNGIAGLVDGALSITGVAPSLDVAQSVASAARGLPQGASPGRIDVTAPAVSPYTWSAARDGNSVTLSGFVPSAEVKAANVSAVSAAVPGATVVDRQQLANGAPNGFAGIAKFAIDQLAKLTNGTASLSNAVLSFSGASATAQVREALNAATRTLPAGFSLGQMNVSTPAPVAPAPVAATPAPVVPAAPPPPPPAVVALPAPVVDVLPPPPPALPSVVAAPVVVPAPPAPVVVPASPAPIVVPAPAPAAQALSGAAAAAAASMACQRQFDELLVEPVLFDTAKDVIRPVSYVLLGKLAQVAKACPTKDIEIAAHTDSDGDDAMNQDLSERRAKAVVEFLVREGVAGTLLKAVGYGETRPIAPNDTPENKQKNRRVVFTVK